MTDNVVKLWKERCQVGNNGGLIPNTHNALIALREDHDLRDVFAKDEMLHAIVVTHEIGVLDTANRVMKESDVINTKVWMNQNGFPSMGIETVREAITVRADENAFHPVRDYLWSLAWDGVPRLGTWLTTYLGAPLNPYTMHIGRMFLTQMVARIARPGCQADYMLVLEGPQGILKSAACRALAGEWFSDNLPELVGDMRVVSQHLRGKWLIEVAELHAFSKAEATKLKSFITRREEIFLARYGRQEVHEPRQCCFVGTTNEDTYLRDATGGRRFWPVKTGVSGRIEIDLLYEARDQLWAEAVAAYDDGVQYWPDAQFEREFIASEQKQRQAGDIWEQTIRPYLEGRTQVTTAEIAQNCLVIHAGQQTQITETRIALVLKSWGWVRKHTKQGNVWEPRGERSVIIP